MCIIFRNPVFVLCLTSMLSVQYLRTRHIGVLDSYNDPEIGRYIG